MTKRNNYWQGFCFSQLQVFSFCPLFNPLQFMSCPSASYLCPSDYPPNSPGCSNSLSWLQLRYCFWLSPRTSPSQVRGTVMPEDYWKSWQKCLHYQHTISWHDIVFALQWLSYLGNPGFMEVSSFALNLLSGHVRMLQSNLKWVHELIVV